MWINHHNIFNLFYFIIFLSFLQVHRILLAIAIIIKGMSPYTHSCRNNVHCKNGCVEKIDRRYLSVVGSPRPPTNISATAESSTYTSCRELHTKEKAYYQICGTTIDTHKLVYTHSKTKLYFFTLSLWSCLAPFPKKTCIGA